MFRLSRNVARDLDNRAKTAGLPGDDGPLFPPGWPCRPRPSRRRGGAQEGEQHPARPLPPVALPDYRPSGHPSNLEPDADDGHKARSLRRFDAPVVPARGGVLRRLGLLRCGGAVWGLGVSDPGVPPVTLALAAFQGSLTPSLSVWLLLMQIATQSGRS